MWPSPVCNMQILMPTSKQFSEHPEFGPQIVFGVLENKNNKKIVSKSLLKALTPVITIWNPSIFSDM
jgi:hypothetical protein